MGSAGSRQKPSPGPNSTSVRRWAIGGASLARTEMPKPMSLDDCIASSSAGGHTMRTIAPGCAPATTATARRTRNTISVGAASLAVASSRTSKVTSGLMTRSSGSPGSGMPTMWRPTIAPRSERSRQAGSHSDGESPRRTRSKSLTPSSRRGNASASEADTLKRAHCAQGAVCGRFWACVKAGVSTPAANAAHLNPAYNERLAWLSPAAAVPS